MATPITPIDQTISTVPALRHRSTVNPTSQADKDDFVIKYEANNDHLANNTVSELNTLKGQVNTTIGQINTAVDTIINAEALISPHYEAIDAVSANEANINNVSINIAKITNLDTNMSDINNLDNNMSDISLVSSAIQGGTLPTIINDTSISNGSTWSSSKIDSELSSKLNATNPMITGSITEEVYELTGTEINPTNGTIQYKTVSDNTTFTETLTAGQSVLLRLIGASSYTITFPTITWVGAVAPVLTANCAIVLWKEQSILYGAHVGTLV